MAKKEPTPKRLAYEAELSDLERQLSDAQSLQLLRMLVDAKIDLNLLLPKGQKTMILFSNIPNRLLGNMVRYARECVRQNEQDLAAATRKYEPPPPSDDDKPQII